MPPDWPQKLHTLQILLLPAFLQRARERLGSVIVRLLLVEPHEYLFVLLGDGLKLVEPEFEERVKSPLAMVVF